MARRPRAPKNAGRSARKTGAPFYGHGIPGVDLDKNSRANSSSSKARTVRAAPRRSELVEWLEGSGHATVQVGLKRSTLVSEELDQAQEGNILSRTTLSLFYATDFADQLENIILPALRAGFMVLADRYIYTLMARDMVRGMDEAWLKNLYGMALVPDAVFYLNVSPEELVQRTFAKNSALDYWESGMDLGLSRDMFDSFLKYQALMAQQFKRLQRTYGFHMLDGHRSVDAINAELRKKIDAVLASEIIRLNPLWPERTKAKNSSWAWTSAERKFSPASSTPNSNSKAPPNSAPRRRGGLTPPGPSRNPGWRGPPPFPGPGLAWAPPGGGRIASSLRRICPAGKTCR